MPSIDKSMEPELKRYLELLQDTLPRDQQATSLGRQNFLNMAESMEKPVSTSKNERHNKWIPSINNKERRSMFTAITTFIVAIAMLFGGASATVYAAQDSLPNDFLYKIKTWSEDAQLSINKDPETKFDLLETYTIRRFNELSSLLEDEESIPPGLVTRLENHLRYMLQLTAQMDNEDMEIALLRIRSMLQEREKLMMKEGENVPEWANPVIAQIQQMLTERLRKVDSGIENPKEFKQQMNSPTEDKGTGSNMDSGIQKETTPLPTGNGEDSSSSPGMCDPAQEDCGIGVDPGYNVPNDSSMNGGKTLEPQGQGESQKQDNNPGSGSGGKP